MTRRKGKSSKSTFGNTRQLPSGRWQARYDDKVTGRTITAPQTFDDEPAADLWLAGQRVERAAGTWVDPLGGEQLIRDYLVTWQRGLVGQRRRLSTTTRDADYVTRYLAPTFGAVALGAVTASTVREWVAALTDAGLAPSTIAKAGQLLSTMFETAVADRLVPSNPCRTVRWPKADRHELDVLDPSEIAALADAIDQRYRAVVLLGCWAGLRIGEIVGLRVGDVDVLRRRVTVSRKVTEVGGRLDVGEPKTRAGRRSVPLPASVADELGELFAGKHRDDLVVEAPHGGYLRLASWRSRYWRGTKERPGAVRLIGRPTFRIHDMRHTAVSLWIAAGVDAKRVAAWAGHASVVSVFDLYGHLFDQGDDGMTELDDLRARSAKSGAEVRPIRRAK